MGKETPKYKLPYPEPTDPCTMWAYWKNLAERAEAVLGPIDAQAAKGPYADANASALYQGILGNDSWQNVATVGLNTAPVSRFVFGFLNTSIVNDVQPTGPWQADVQISFNGGAASRTWAATSPLGARIVQRTIFAVSTIAPDAAFTATAEVYLSGGNKQTHCGYWPVLSVMAFPVY